MLAWLKEMLGIRDAVEMPEPLRREVVQAAEAFYRANFPPTVSPAGGSVWADEATRFVVAITDFSPGMIDFLAVDKRTLAVSVVEDQLHYRPRGLK